MAGLWFNEKNRVVSTEHLAVPKRRAAGFCPVIKAAGGYWLFRVCLNTEYRRRSGKFGDEQAVASPNFLNRRFDIVEPFTVGATYIAYIRKKEAWLYFAVLLDFALSSRSWSLESHRSVIWPLMC